MPNGFTKASQVVQDDLGLGIEFVLIRSVQMPAIEHGEVSVGVEHRENQAPLRMEYAVQFPNRNQW